MSDTDQEPKPPTQQTQPQGINPKTGKPYRGSRFRSRAEDDFEKLVRRAMKDRDRSPSGPDD